MCQEVAPEAIMIFLNDLFSRFDELTSIYGVYKIEVRAAGARVVNGMGCTAPQPD